MHDILKSFPVFYYIYVNCRVFCRPPSRVTECRNILRQITDFQCMCNYSCQSHNINLTITVPHRIDSVSLAKSDLWQTEALADMTGVWMSDDKELWSDKWNNIKCSWENWRKMEGTFRSEKKLSFILHSEPSPPWWTRENIHNILSIPFITQFIIHFHRNFHDIVELITKSWISLSSNISYEIAQSKDNLLIILACK